MSNITDVFFFIGFIGMVSLFGYKVWNLISGAEAYDLRGTFFTFAGYLIAWFLALIAMLSEPETLIYRVLFVFGSLFLSFMIVLSIIETLIYLGRIGQNPQRERRFSNMEV